MLNEAKIKTGIMDRAYEPELCMLIDAALKEMETRGISVDGSFTYTTAVITAEEAEEAGEPETEGMLKVSSWACDIEDSWVKNTVLTYVAANARGTENPEKLMNAYENMLDRMMHTTGYHRGWGA